MSVEELDRRFGVVAIEKGFIQLEHLFEAMKIQILEDLEGTHHRVIGQILWEKGFMTTRQINEVVKAMGI